jgi:hypothetical protein
MKTYQKIGKKMSHMANSYAQYDQRRKNKNRQFNGQRRRQWQNSTKTDDGNGHEIPLAMQPQMPRTIQNILAAGKIKLCRLLDKASFSKASRKYSKRILDAHGP